MRQIISLNQKWAFTKQASAPPAAMPADWYWVNLPHSWNSIDGQDGGSDYFRGTAYYAKTVEKLGLPAADRYYLEVKGANSSAVFWLNGQELARHDGGYSTWRVDVTDALRDSNLFVFAVDNAPNQRVYPQMADFTFYGGLYRGVSLICVSESHFDLMYHGGPGIAVTPAVNGDDADVTVEVRVENFKESQTLAFTLKDAAGNTVAEAAGADTKAAFTIPKVHKWHGRRDPYLYTAEVCLLEDGEVLDSVSARFGCRSYRVDPDLGFILNGEEYPLRGVSRHQDRWGVGNALTPEMHKEDIDLICEVGATTIRLAHYQHDQYFYDLCDERGLVIWAEIPYITTHLMEGTENTVQQMTELITQNYNHPSIVVWGLSNEIDAGGPNNDAVVANHKLLNELAHKLDPTRLTTMAVVSTCDPHHEYINIPDTISYNHYFGWYGGDVSDYGPWLDKFHAEHPRTPLGLSEYGCEALNWHNSNPCAGDYSEEYQAYYHEEMIRQLFSRKYLWATHVWNMFDFGADARSEGGENGQNHKGLVTFDRKYKKDSFYAYKAWLSDEPFVHIAGKRYVDRAEEVTKVTVYSNLPEVELFANGVSLGKQRSAEHFFYFQAPNDGETKLLAVAGDCRDESVIRKVTQPNPAYRLTERGVILNWWDITEPEGCCSLNTRIKDVVASIGMDGYLKLMKPYVDFGDPKFVKMMDNMSVLRMLNLITGIAPVPVSKEALLDLNVKLNAIPLK